MERPESGCGGHGTQGCEEGGGNGLSSFGQCRLRDIIAQNSVDVQPSLRQRGTEGPTPDCGQWEPRGGAITDGL